ncbi:ATP synthase F1 subunit epsilon [Gloeocapsa sp. PCC 73106]|uniref:ATP synthase F1 subunit epsilon n=1 Tax=Gloeocapsa sp. PCC 73106 TaxID=102232 RepID=UPI0002AC820E|nr:ATP synthase F1 subunit epsilon [Gloeocapsa sp. PCC 73106]ELR97367.1 ATP synthase, F1 epsilon subunit [Gloeocapsa sp. PCC 73106]
MSLNVRVITPDKVVWDNAVQEVILPSTTGQLGILPGHAPLTTALGSGVMRIRVDKEWKNIALMGGFALVEDNEVKILVNAAQMGESINLETARAEFEQAEKQYNETMKTGTRQQQIQATQAFKKARVRLQAAGGLVKL